MAGTPKRRKDVDFLNDMPEEMIFSMVESGKSIADICIDLGIGKRALDDWIEENDHSAMITRARVITVLGLRARACVPPILWPVTR